MVVFRTLLVWAVLSCASIQASEVTPAAQLPTEYFTRADQFGTLKISPDGAHIAFTAGENGSTLLAFMDRTSRKIVGGVRCPDGFEIDDFSWISTQRLIYSIAERQPGRVQPTPTGEIFAIGVDGEKHKRLYGYRAGEMKTGTHLRTRDNSYATALLISPLKNDENNILIAEYPWKLIGNTWYTDPDARPSITRLNVFNGKKQELGKAPLGRARLLVDREENVRFAIGRNEQFQLAVSWKPQPDAPWAAFDLKGFREETVVPHRFGSDNRSVLLTGVREDEAHEALYRLDLETRELQRLASFEGADIDGLVSDFADRETVGLWAYKDRPVYQWINADDPAARLHAALQRAFKGFSVRITSLTEDGKLAVVFVQSDVNPGDYYLFDTVAKRADILQRTRDWVDSRLMRPKTPIELKARDGVPLHGYLTKPAGAGPHPLVVLPHGGPHNVRDRWEFEPDVQLLAHRGYAVLQVNFRGSGGYGRGFEAAGFREWGGRMQDDLTDATHWAIEQKIAPDDRICIFGASYGGYAALMGAAREPALYRCAIGYAGVYDLELMLTRGDIPKFRSGQNYLDNVIGSDPVELRERSPTHLARNITAPVLLIHGRVDGRADYVHAKRMKSELEKHQKPLEWMALSREGHGIYDEATRREVFDRVIRFLDQHLKVERASAQASATDVPQR